MPSQPGLQAPWLTRTLWAAICPPGGPRPASPQHRHYPAAPDPAMRGRPPPPTTSAPPPPPRPPPLPARPGALRLLPTYPPPAVTTPADPGCAAHLAFGIDRAPAPGTREETGAGPAPAAATMTSGQP